MDSFVEGVKRPCTEPVFEAVIYEWRLTNVDMEHPLFDITYVGQTCRGGMTGEKALQERTKRHERDSTGHDGDLGLHAMIRDYGMEVFTVTILETYSGTYEEAHAWADERERALIEERGGMLQDMDEMPEGGQTLNLTKGGQGDTTGHWELIQVKSNLKWSRVVQPALETYYASNGDLRIPKSYATHDGVKLGQIVKKIRFTRLFVRHHPERLTWLEERGWVENERDATWEQDIQPELEKFFLEHRHLNIPQRYQTGGIKLGLFVSNVRANLEEYSKKHPERMAWLQERGWIDNANNAAWEKIRESLDNYFTVHGNLNVSQRYVTEDGFKLGHIVNDMRSGYCYVRGRPDRVEFLEERGWVWNIKDDYWERVLVPEFMTYYSRHGNLRIPRNFVSENDIKLGSIVHTIRNQKCWVSGYPERTQWLLDLGFVQNTQEEAWLNFKEELVEYLEKHKTFSVPVSFQTKRGYYLRQQIQNVRNSHLHCFIKNHPDRAKFLYNLGFKMNTQDPVKNERIWASLLPPPES
jgi:hypothetical protein